jgi:hypothetical protein
MSISNLMVFQESPDSCSVGFGQIHGVEPQSEAALADSFLRENSQDQLKEKLALRREWIYTLVQCFFEQSEGFRSGHFLDGSKCANSKLPRNDQAVSLSSQTGKLFVTHSVSSHSGVPNVRIVSSAFGST